MAYTRFEVVITAIIQKDGKYLITRRPATKKRFPGKWTVPGGHLEPSDFTGYPKDTEHYWYNVLEKALAREILEEVGLAIENVRYVTSLATEHDGAAASIVISCLADHAGGEVKLEEAENDKYAWVDVEESKEYDLLDGIYDEIVMADALRKGEKYVWKRH
ncbi:NUDIX domain-containing protein [Candidatus Kaiserbacteria bacterium]|nr:NUDIX domain-containing protein [Candidatus Kaiserbacteria bacterium]